MRGNLKSQNEEFVLALFQTLLRQDLPRMHGYQKEFAKDLNTIQSRTRTEGMSFLTKTLPGLGKAIDAALLGPPLLISNFKLRKRKLRNKVVTYAIPNFLWGLLSRVFNPLTGRVYRFPDICALNDLRQICYLAYKLEMPYEERQIESIVKSFQETDAQLPTDLSIHEDPVVERALASANSLLRDLLADFDPTEIVPQHGPGVVATGEKPWEKYSFTRAYRQIEDVFPFEEYYCLDRSHYWESLYKRDFQYAESGCAKVMFVPKDSRGPRLISSEPVEYMFIQQGINRKLMPWIERHPLSKGVVNFTSQEVNRDLALQASISGDLVTLDMKEASDRVSVALVRRLFAGTKLLPALLATRTPQTLLPSGEVMRMQKFAPMGSALCFPIEALCFWALGAGLQHVLTKQPLRRAAKSFFVYGDDIIVQRSQTVALQYYFPKVGLMFNKGKCCTTGFFRESCGCDAMNGEDITPIKLRKCPPHSFSNDASLLLSTLEMSNFFWKKAYYSTGNFIKDHIERIYGPLPLMHQHDKEAPLLPSWFHRTQLDSVQKGLKKRWNKKYQRFEYQVYTTRTPKYFGALDRSELLRSLTIGGSPPTELAKLERYAGRKHWSHLKYCTIDESVRAGVYTLPRRVHLKRGWSSLVY